MTRLRVLAIDTSTEACSAALLWSDGEVRERFVVTERGHADLVLPMIDGLLAEAGCRLTDLDGLAFGRGPGGFTGLRIAAGVIQGLAYGASLKVAPVSSLAAVAYMTAFPTTPASVGLSTSPASVGLSTSPASVGEVARSAGEGSRPSPQPSPAVAGEGVGTGGILVCNDARMNEVYWGCYQFAPGDPDIPVVLSPEAVSPPDSVVPGPGMTYFAGNGIGRYPELALRLAALGLHFRDQPYPRARAVAQIGAGQLRRGESVAAADALPVYIRNDVARPASTPVMPVS